MLKKSSIYCENISIEDSSSFLLIKIYEEVKENDKENSIIEKEPIDVLIKYIDLKDPFLKREGIHQIKKDIENEELRYAVRSILKYIPWIRKIFILMPNEKVRYFKEYKYIKNKIVYVKDKDLLGYDSSNSHAFQFRYWKMKKFGISDNIIAMDDDYFIGGPLNKSDFFYLENGKVVPSIITSKFLFIDKITALKEIERCKKIIMNTKNDQINEMYDHSVYLTYLYFINMFNKSVIIPRYTHTAMPINLKELKDMYDIIYNSKYKSTTLDSLYRHYETFQFQAFIFSYSFLKLNRKIKSISYKYMNNRNTIYDNYNFSLLCINTGAINYSNLSFLQSRIVMEYLFPEPTPYEIANYSFSSIAFNVMYLMNKEIKIYKNKLKNNSNKLNCQLFWIIVFFNCILINIKIYKNYRFQITNIYSFKIKDDEFDKIKEYL